MNYGLGGLLAYANNGFCFLGFNLFFPQISQMVKLRINAVANCLAHVSSKLVSRRFSQRCLILDFRLLILEDLSFKSKIYALKSKIKFPADFADLQASKDMRFQLAKTELL